MNGLDHMVLQTNGSLIEGLSFSSSLSCLDEGHYEFMIHYIELHLSIFTLIHIEYQCMNIMILIDIKDGSIITIILIFMIDRAFNISSASPLTVTPYVNLSFISQYSLSSWH